MKAKNQHGSVRVYTRRHIGECKLTATDATGCSCPKWIYAKRAGMHDTITSAGTPSYAEACEIAMTLLKSWDPLRAEIKELRAEQGKSGGTVEAEVNTFLLKIEQNQSKEAAYLYRFVLGDLVRYCSTENIGMLQQVDEAVLLEWRATWRKRDGAEYSNVTKGNQWGPVCRFFRWSVAKRIIAHNPAAGIGRPKVAKGNRCGFFTPEQYSAILRVTRVYPQLQGYSVADMEKLRIRLEAIIELMRWTGAAIIDATLFRTASLHAPILTYKRQKTKVIATPGSIPAHVKAMLLNVPTTESYPDRGQPFFNPFVKTACGQTGFWRAHFQKICRLAGIFKVKTDAGTVIAPHPHMLRDTFAISKLCARASIYDVSKALGHASVAMTTTAYEPYCMEHHLTIADRLAETMAKELAAESDAHASSHLEAVVSGR